MKIKPNIESLIYAFILVLSAAALAFVALSPGQFSNTRIVYQGF